MFFYGRRCRITAKKLTLWQLFEHIRAVVWSSIPSGTVIISHADSRYYCDLFASELPRGNVLSFDEEAGAETSVLDSLLRPTSHWNRRSVDV